MTAYIGVLEKEPGTLWGIWFPDLPGCIAAAETADAAIAQAGEALAQWIELAREDGEEVPPPRGLEALREDDEFSEALTSGNAAIAIRLATDDLGFDDGALKALDEAAERRGLSRQGFVREAVLEKIAS